MVSKKPIAFTLITMVMFYIASPLIFERQFFFNEIIALSGLFIYSYKKFMITRSTINAAFILLLSLSVIHGFVSIFWADSLYLYLRNFVILYSMFAFFLGYFLYEYFILYFQKFGSFIRNYIIVFLLIPFPYGFDRFGMSTLFPFILKKVKTNLVLPLLIILTILYAYNYKSSTSLVLSCFYFFLLISYNYKIFQISALAIVIAFLLFLIYIFPFASMDPALYSYENNVGIKHVMQSHPLLEIDPNNTWRIVIWKQLIVDLFPRNLIGIGFGTPALMYFPIADFAVVADLPYILGGHNSFVYLFSRLGIAFIILIGFIFIKIFREYFLIRKYYYADWSMLVFLGFFAVSVVAFFNPVLESPIYASTFWLLLGMTSKVIDIRKLKTSNEE